VIGTKPTPGQRHKLHRMGVSSRRIGRTFNRATLPMPKNADELEEMLNDGAKSQEILKDKQSLKNFITAYADEQQGDGTELRRQITDEATRVLTQMLKDKEVSANETDAIKRLNLDPQNRPANMLTSHKQAAAYNPKAPGAVIDNEFSSAAEFFASAWHLNPDAGARAKMETLRNAYSSTVPADGGFLVPETLRSQLLQIALEMSVIRPRATVVPMETARVPFPMIDVTSNATSVFGGMIGYWGEEGSPLTDSSAKFGRVVLDAKKLTGLSVVPNELLTDSLLSFSALIESLWPRALAFYEDVAFMAGSGVGEPLGALGNPASVAVAAESGQQSATIQLENIIKMYARMMPSSLSQAIWLCTPEAFPQLMTMALSVGTGGSAVMLTNAAGPAPMSVLGRPLIITEKAKQLGVQGDIAFVDLSYYLVGDRQQMTAASSTDWKFGNDQTAFRLIERVDGQPWIKSAITPQNGGPALSPFVELAARP
jgi:HK97 family phage major capsid protein